MPIGGYTAVSYFLDEQKIVQLFVEKSEIYLYPGLLSKWNFQDVHI